jgi:predicted DNA-binding WGR domain protein
MNRCAPTDSWNSLDGVDLGRDDCLMPTEDVIHLHRIDPARNMARFYRLSSTPSLFGDICIVREWGRIGRRGRTRIDLYAREAEAAAARLALELAKRRRGYRDAPGIE